MEDRMTDYQFRSLLKLVLDILKSSESKEAAIQRIEALIEDK